VNNPISVRKETMALQNAAKKEPSLIGKSLFCVHRRASGDSNR
jgi:hypothetical protein